MRVMVVSSDPLARAGLVNLLEGLDELEVPDQHPGDHSLTAAYESGLPEAVVWDLGSELDSTDWRDQLTDLTDAGAPVVALVANSTQAAEAGTCGARGLLNREGSPERIATAIHAVAGGLMVSDPEFAPHAGLGGSVEPLVEELTDREREVLALMAEGLPNKTIAQRLEITEHTVKFHVNAVLRKLGAQSRTEAVVRATRLGLILL